MKKMLSTLLLGMVMSNAAFAADPDKPITAVVLILLFWVQSSGTARVSAFFGPITVVWFLVLAALGVVGL